MTKPRSSACSIFQPRRDGVSAAPFANCYAALTELQHYCQPNAVFSAHYETAASTAKGERVRLVGPAFQRCIMLPLPEPKASYPASTIRPPSSRAGDFLYRDLATVLGPTIDEQRTSKIATADPTTAEAGAALAIDRHGPHPVASPRPARRIVTRGCAANWSRAG